MDIAEAVYLAAKKNVENAFNEEKIMEEFKKFKKTLHILPESERVYYGRLHALKINFGDVCVDIAVEIINSSDRTELHNLSGKKIKENISDQGGVLIDTYMRSHKETQTTLSEFNELIKSLKENEIGITGSNKKIDVDLLFKDLETGDLYFYEAKYNDDHDTGKFKNLNQKVLDTYASLLNILNDKERDILIANLMYFTETVRYGPQYIPKEHQRRGGEFFKKHLNYDISYLDELYKLAANEMEPLLQDKYKEIVIDKKYNS